MRIPSVFKLVAITLSLLIVLELGAIFLIKFLHLQSPISVAITSAICVAVIVSMYNRFKRSQEDQ